MVQRLIQAKEKEIKAAEFIKIVHDDMQELYDLHQLSVSSGGKLGLRCLNPEDFEKKMRRTDREILELYLAEGAQIEDADEYLANLKQ